MYRLTIIRFGKIKNSGTVQIAGHYLTLLQKYFNTELIVRKDPGERKIKLSDIENDLQGKFNIILTEKGLQQTSIRFSQFISKQADSGSKLQFIVGNAYGIETDLAKAADYQLSLSKMTLAHDLAYLVLLEQLFRAGAISAGSAYHK